jgi:hypothetical protein
MRLAGATVQARKEIGTVCHGNHNKLEDRPMRRGTAALKKTFLKPARSMT